MIYREVIDNIFYTLEKLRITQRVGFYFTLWLTYHAVEFSFTLGSSVKDWSDAGVGLAAFVAAIMVPITGLQGASLKFQQYESDPKAKTNS